VLLVREPVRRAAHPSLAPRRLTVPAQIRAVFVRAAIAGFAGFAMMGLFSAVSPAFLSDVLGEHNLAVIGAVALSVFAASVLGQVTSIRLGVDRSLRFGCVALIAGMVLVGVSLLIKSLPLLLVAAIVAGVGQGMSFRAGLASVSEAVPGEKRGAVTSTLFVTLYVGISIPVIGVGAMAVGAGLITAGVVLAGLVAALTAVALGLLARDR
jgi:MFS family permease